MPKLRVAGFILGACCLASVPAVAQTASLKQRILANPQGEIVQAIKMLAATEGKHERQRGGEIAINWCHIYANWHGSRDDDFLEHFEHVARTYVHYRRQLEAFGYPSDLVRGDVDAVAMAYLAEIQRRRSGGLDLRDIAGIKRAILPAERRLGQRMNAYRQQDRTLARPTVWNECGGDYMGFAKVKAQPSSGTIRLIREFYYKLCQASGIDPQSNQCDKWQLVASDLDMPGGIYYYQARWPNTPTECDRIQFDGASPTEDGKVVTIRQSGRGCGR